MFAVDTGWKLFDFLGGICFNFNRILPGNETVIFFLGTYNVCFTKIICINITVTDSPI